MYPSRVKRRADFISVEEMKNALEEWARKGVGSVTHRDSVSSFWPYKSIAEYDEKVYAWSSDHLSVITPRHQIKPPIRSWWKWIAGWIGTWALIFVSAPIIGVISWFAFSIFPHSDSFLVSFWSVAVLFFPLLFLVTTPVYKYFGGPTHHHALKVDKYVFEQHVRAAIQLVNEDDLLLLTQAVVAAGEHPAANDAAVKLVNKHAPQVESRLKIQREQIAAEKKAAAQELQHIREEAERVKVQSQVEKELNDRQWQAINDGLD